MNEQKTVKILWLSDIHFRSEYDLAVIDQGRAADGTPKLSATEKEARKQKVREIDALIKKFLATVADYCNELERSGEFLDYILISGDLAFSASKKDYGLLQKKILQPLIEIAGNKTSVLTVPGNHDVSWTSSDFFKSFIYNIVDKTDKEIKQEYYQRRNEYLRDKDDFFKTIFQNYSAHFKDYVKPYISESDSSMKYRKDGLYGMIIDKANNLIINLLNSAWYALGEKFDMMLIDIMVDHYASMIKDSATDDEDEKAYKEKFKKLITTVISLKSATSEYGEQVLGESFVMTEDPFKQLEQYPGYFVLTVFHHPMNWLLYSQKYRLKSSEHDQLFLNRLLQYTDMLLTGHEHVPASSISEKINREVHHLKAGMFMQDNLFGEIEGEHRFSILEIDTYRFKFKEKKYVYEWNSKTYKYAQEFSIYNWERSRVKNPKLDSAKEIELMGKVRKPEVLQKILTSYFFVAEVATSFDLYREAEEYVLYTFKHPTFESRLIILPLSKHFYHDALQKEMSHPDDVHCLDEIVRTALGMQIETICMVTPDFLVDAGLNTRYYIPDAGYQADMNYTGIVKKSDFIFNRARHHFFYRFEQKVQDTGMDTATVNGIEFQSIKDIRFCNLVIPFWGIDRYG